MGQWQGKKPHKNQGLGLNSVEVLALVGPKCRLMEKTKENGTAQLLFNLEPQCYDYISCKTKLIFQKPL